MERERERERENEKQREKGYASFRASSPPPLPPIR